MFERAAEALGAAEDVAIPDFEEAFATAMRLLSTDEATRAIAARLAEEAIRIGQGISSVEPKPSDWRFKHAAWTEHPAYRLVAQFYVAWADAVTEVLEGTETQDWRTKEQARFMTAILTSAMAPTNFLLGNPAALDQAVASGGESLRRGMQQYLNDREHNGGMPAPVDAAGFKVGENLATTPGVVVARNEMLEVIQYQPSGATVRQRPLLVVPPPIGKYYFLDLAPGRSLFEYVRGQGLSLFTISWRNPGAEQAAWDLDDYAAAILEAIDAVCDAAGSPDVNTLGVCAGGILLTTVMNRLAAQGDTRVHTASLAVTLLDFDVPAALGAFSPSAMLSIARSKSAGKGVFEAREMANVFAWLRPNDLVWNYWVNNYLMGEKPPAVDLMAWNADGTNLPAALHAQFLNIFGDNLLCKPGSLDVLGTPVDLGRVGCETYVMAAIADHITPWKGCYRTTQLLRGRSTFVLSNSGHIAGLVNPPGNPKARYFAGPVPGPDPDAWLALASERPGSWWEHWADWLNQRSGEMRPAPETLGSERYPVLGPAPGEYVFG